jgi:hypothetical protein
MVCKMIATHAVLSLEMTDHWLNGGAAPATLTSPGCLCPINRVPGLLCVDPVRLSRDRGSFI